MAMASSAINFASKKFSVQKIYMTIIIGCELRFIQFQSFKDHYFMLFSNEFIDVDTVTAAAFNLIPQISL